MSYSLVCRICENGHYIYGGGNVSFCGNGTGCYHQIKKGRNAHKFQYEYGKNEFCKVCEKKGLDSNLYKIKERI